MTIVVDTIDAIKKIRQQLHPKRVGFVATMGNLHCGHASLLQRANNENDCSILSIFVNPTQFNEPSDYQRYPRTQQQDLQIARENKVDYVFVPNAGDLYPDDYRYHISENNLATLMEGKFRPGHFNGMLTIVMKLLQITQPTRAYFGEKDFQQYQLVCGMARAFFLDTEIIACPTIREPSGLAYSSRNNLLTEQQKQHAAHFYRALTTATTCENATALLNDLGFRVEYIEEIHQRRYGAIYLGNVRLIDNVSQEDLQFAINRT